MKYITRPCTWVKIILINLLFSSAIYSQEKIQISLMDSLTHTPISNALYRYEKQTGKSDMLGNITLTYQKGKSLFLYHDDYENWVISDKEIIKSNENPTFYKKNIFKVIPLISITSEKKKTANYTYIKLNEADYSSPDAGNLLAENPEFGGVRKSGRFGFDPVLRGFKYEQLNIVENGMQSALNACPSRMDPATSHIAANSVERIEILKGPFSFRYGNSFGGTVNYISSASHLYSEKKKWYGRISGNYENNGDLLTSEGLLGIKTKQYNLNFFGSQAQSHDYKDGKGREVPSDFNKYNYGLNLNLRTENNQQFTFKASRSYVSDVDFASLGMDMREDETLSASAVHKAEFKTTKLKYWETGMYVSSVNHLMDNLLRDTRKMDMTTKAYTRSYGMRTEGYWKLNNAKLYTGADLKTESARGTRYKTPLTGAMAGKTSEDNVWQDAVITHTSVFAEYVTHFNRFDFSASGRLEWNRSWSDKEDADFKKLYNNKTDDSQINPNLSMGLVYNIKKNTSLGLWVGRAQRSGSISERYINYFTVSLDPYEVVGNPTIKAEKNNQADLIFNFKTEKTFINIDVFGSYLQDYISSVIRSDLKPKMPSSPGVRQVTNIGKVWKYGVEINWKQELIAGFSHQLSLAYTYGKDLELKEPLPEIAPLYIRYNLYTHFFNRRLTTLLALRHVLKQDRVSYSFAETTTPSFTLLDIDLSYSFTEKIRLSGGVKNLLDTDYHEHLTRALNTNKNEYISAPGRSFFTSFLFSF